MHTPEWHEKKKIKQYLDSIGAWHFSPATIGFGKSGMPDIIFCYRGRFASVEVKREGKQPTKLQEQRMDEVMLAGGFAIWGTAERVIPIVAKWIQPDPAYVPGKPR